MKIDYDHKTTAWDDIKRWLKAMLNEAKSFLLLLFFPQLHIWIIGLRFQRIFYVLV